MANPVFNGASFWLGGEAWCIVSMSIGLWAGLGFYRWRLRLTSMMTYSLTVVHGHANTRTWQGITNDQD
jgi:hypothetical protein